MTSMHGTFHSFLANRPLPKSTDAAAALALTAAAASGARFRLSPSMAAETSAPAVLFTVDASSDTVSMAMSTAREAFDDAGATADSFVAAKEVEADSGW